MAGLLSDYNVPYTTVSLQSVYIASVSLTFEVTLNSSASEYEEAFSGFLNFFNIELTSFGGFAVLPGARGSLGVIPSGKEEMEKENLRSSWDLNPGSSDY